MTRFGYLGPEGTFTQMALDAWGRRRRRQRTSRSARSTRRWRALRAGDIDGAMVPIENSVEGGVSATLDALASGDPLVVTGEVLVPITFVLAARAGARARGGARGRHPLHAWAQVRGWMGEHLPDAVYVPTLSTAAAAAALEHGDAAAYDAAVCAPVAARTARARGAGRRHRRQLQSAVTRFVLVPGRAGCPSHRRRQDHRGALPARRPRRWTARAARAVRGARHQHDPARVAPDQGVDGRYCFSIDIEGHVLDERVGEALMGLKRVCAEVRFVGSYPAAHGTAVQVSQHTTDQSFADARAWLRGLRAQHEV